MSPLREYLKGRILELFPEDLLQPLRRYRQLQVIRSMTDAEEPDLAVVRHLVGPGNNVIDAGANAGIYTKVLSELVGRSGHVLSVEPVPRTYSVLTHNVKALGLTNVRCVDVALSDRDQILNMVCPKWETGGLNFYQARVTADETALKVRATTLDALVSDRPDIHFIKVDVEGHELACLAGASRLLNSGTAAWLVEVSGNPDEPGDAGWSVLKRFGEQGYGAWWYDGSTLRQRSRGTASVNYFFLKDSHIQRLRRSPIRIEG